MRIRPRKKLDIDQSLRSFAEGCIFAYLAGAEPRKAIEDGYFYIQSPQVKINDHPYKIEENIDNAFRSLELSYQAIFNMGINIELICLSWHNVMDSCDNITGSNGFFYLKFKINKE